MKAAVTTPSGPFLISAEILVCRGAVSEGLALRDAALERVSDDVDLQQAVPALVAGAWVSLLADEEPRARELALAVTPWFERSKHRAPGMSAVGPVVALRTGLGDTWATFVERNAPIKRQRAALLLLRGRAVEAADLWAEVSPCSSSAGSRSTAPSARRASSSRPKSCSRRRPKTFSATVDAHTPPSRAGRAGRDCRARGSRRARAVPAPDPGGA